MANPNPLRQREARSHIDELFGHPASVFVIHYACQSFRQDQKMGSPRITAIAARNLGSGETATFSIHVEAELARLGPVRILTLMDQLERALLDKVFAFLKENQKMRFVHWNMRDAVFGFPAIEHRYAVLGGTSAAIPEAHKTDLARTLVDIYGSGYVAAPFLESLAKLNGLILTDFLAGDAEADAFERGNYLEVQRSTLTKVRLLFDILQLAHDRTLKSRATWWTMNVGRVREAYEICVGNPLYAIGAAIITAIGVALKILEYLGGK